MFKELWKLLGLVKDFSSAKECYGKRWFTSRTLWVNFLALLAMVLQNHWGFVLPAEVQTALLIVINFVLRLVTDQPVVTTESKIICNPDSSPVIQAKSLGECITRNETPMPDKLKDNSSGISPNKTQDY